MGRRKFTPLGRVKDIYGDVWLIAKKVPCGQRWPMCKGYPEGEYRGKGGRGVSVILTPQLVAYLTRHRDRPRDIVLPIDRSTICRIRKNLGHRWREERPQWWLDREEDLEALTCTAFAAKHDVSCGIAATWRSRFFGARARAVRWWMDEPVRSDFLTLPGAYLAGKYGLTASSVRRIRRTIRAGGMSTKRPG